MRRYVIDYFEGSLAHLLSLKDDHRKKVPREQLPRTSQEGDVLSLRFDRKGKIKEARLMREETKKHKKKVRELLYKLMAKDK